jgi:hypothetical protein
MWKSMVSSFVSAGVPLFVFRNPGVKQWIHQHVKSGRDLPTEPTLRKYLVEEGGEDLIATRDICK